MDERRRAELLVVRLRWIALLAAAFKLDAPLSTSAVLVIMTIFLYNVFASQVVTDKSLFARYGHIVAPVTRSLDLAAIALATHCDGLGAKSLYLLYSFVIISTGYVYNRLLPTVTALLASLTLDSASISFRANHVENEMSLITQHAAAYFMSALIASYIIAFRRQDESMRIKERKLSALFECGTRFTSAHDLNQLLNHVLDTAILEIGAVGGTIMLLDSDNHLVSEVVRREYDAADESPDYEVANDVLSTGQPILLNPGASDETLSIRDTTTGSVICVPLVDRTNDEPSGRYELSPTKIIGTISVYNNRRGAAFGLEDLELLRTLAIHASMGIVNARLYRELHDTFVRTLQSLARSLEARDPYTQGHSYRVSEISQLVASKLELSSEAIDVLRNAALLHDIGKIGIPDAVLQKPGRLTQEEYLIIQTHPVTSENICRPLGLGKDVLFLIRHHQERLNASGYPDHLPADQHPLPLRILSAVDVVDAMSSDRPYRKALSREDVIEQLNKGAGTEFDPVIVELLKSLLLSGELDRFYTKTDDTLRAA